MREIVEAWDGLRWRIRCAVVPFAVQSFIFQAAFSKDATYENTWEMYQRAIGLKLGE